MNRRHRIRKQSTPPAGGGLKRKGHASQTPPPKRIKSETSNAADDPTRKYCLGKLEELFRDAFFRYPHVCLESCDGDGFDQPAALVQKPLDSLTEGEKDAVLNESKHFAMELEKAIFEIYSELDKEGHLSAGSKYKYGKRISLALDANKHIIGIASECFNLISANLIESFFTNGLRLV